MLHNIIHYYIIIIFSGVSRQLESESPALSPQQRYLHLALDARTTQNVTFEILISYFRQNYCNGVTDHRVLQPSDRPGEGNNNTVNTSGDAP